jgi:TetR/AcrR family transcriptional repressor of nem operon
MYEKGEATRAKIIKAAEGLVLKQGYAGTSLDDVLKITGLTKGAFFHHFKSKAELGRAIVQSYAEADFKLFAEWAVRADRLSDDPYERVMIYLKLMEEFLGQLEEPLDGCIFASYMYQREGFEPDVHAFIRQRVEHWLKLYEEKFAALIKARPPAVPVTARGLAEAIAALIQGSFVMANFLEDRDYMLRRSRQFRQYLELLFKPRG